MKRLISLTIVLALALIPSAVAAESQKLTPEQRKELITEKLEELIPHNTLHRNPFWSTYTEEPRYSFIMANPDIRDQINATQDTYKKLALGIFTDITGNEWYAHLVGFGVYSNMILGYPDGSFKGNQSVTIGEFGVMMARSIYKQEDIDGRQELMQQQIANGARSIGWENKWWYGGIDMMSTAMPNQWGLEESRNRHVADIYGDSPMSRGDVAYAIAEYYFATELSDTINKIGGDLWGEVKGGWMPENTFSDIKKINPSTTRKAIVSARKASETGARFTDFELHRDCIAHPERGVPVRYLAAMTILKDKGIMNGYPDGRSGWNDTVTRADVLQFFANLGEYDIKNGD